MKFANLHGYSDVNPFEVVRIVSDKTIEIRRMDTEKDESVKLEFHVGGFSAHCSNQRDQKWIITSQPDASVIRIRLSKNKGWRDANGQRYVLADAPIKYYDYNF